jgi:hypothetical protein
MRIGKFANVQEMALSIKENVLSVNKIKFLRRRQVSACVERINF